MAQAGNGPAIIAAEADWERREAAGIYLFGVVAFAFLSVLFGLGASLTRSEAAWTLAALCAFALLGCIIGFTRRRRAPGMRAEVVAGKLVNAGPYRNEALPLDNIDHAVVVRVGRSGTLPGYVTKGGKTHIFYESAASHTPTQEVVARLQAQLPPATPEQSSRVEVWPRKSSKLVCTFLGLLGIADLAMAVISSNRDTIEFGLFMAGAGALQFVFWWPQAHRRTAFESREGRIVRKSAWGWSRAIPLRDVANVRVTTNFWWQWLEVRLKDGSARRWGIFQLHELELQRFCAFVNGQAGEQPPGSETE